MSPGYASTFSRARRDGQGPREFAYSPVFVVDLTQRLVRSSPIVSLTRLQGSLHATARVLAPSKEAFDTPLSPPPLNDEPGPATGRSGAYPDGTSTRRPGPASRTQHVPHTTGYSWRHTPQSPHRSPVPAAVTLPGMTRWRSSAPWPGEITEPASTPGCRLRQPCVHTGKPSCLLSGAVAVVPPAGPELETGPGAGRVQQAQGCAETGPGGGENRGRDWHGIGDEGTGADRLRSGRPPDAGLR